MTAHLHAALAIVTNSMEKEKHPLAWIARCALTDAGPPTQPAMQSFIDRLQDVVDMGDWFDT